MTAFMRRHSFTYSVAGKRSLTFHRTFLQNLLPHIPKAKSFVGFMEGLDRHLVQLGALQSSSPGLFVQCVGVDLEMSMVVFTGGASQIIEGGHRAEQRL